MSEEFVVELMLKEKSKVTGSKLTYYQEPLIFIIQRKYARNEVSNVFPSFR